jgi:hypothetical protein
MNEFCQSSASLAGKHIGLARVSQGLVAVRPDLPGEPWPRMCVARRPKRVRGPFKMKRDCMTARRFPPPLAH